MEALVFDVRDISYEKVDELRFEETVVVIDDLMAVRSHHHEGFIQLVGGFRL
jgi:hypothetical protein